MRPKASTILPYIQGNRLLQNYSKLLIYKNLDTKGNYKNVKVVKGVISLTKEEQKTFLELQNCQRVEIRKSLVSLYFLYIILMIINAVLISSAL